MGAGVHEPANQRGQVKAAVDPVLRLGEVAVAVLGEIEVMTDASDRGLGVGDEGVDPTERLQLAGLALPDDDRAVAGDLAPAPLKLASPSVTRCTVGCRAAFAQRARVSLLRLSTASKRACRGCLSSLSSTAATKTDLFSDPRQGLPECMPPRTASSAKTTPCSRRADSRRAMASSSLCLTRHAVL